MVEVQATVGSGKTAGDLVPVPILKKVSIGLVSEQVMYSIF
jgi:hypothetical protein